MERHLKRRMTAMTADKLSKVTAVMTEASLLSYLEGGSGSTSLDIVSVGLAKLTDRVKLV
ncbi:hypothetical protein RRF57_012758 [Xylaria bambusicola]|uniref:Uncharacterized protein n=1 Tax=Xylaria bambusicola TaxID=326684 RepID=A0AAN7V0Z0_9PEZI